MVSIRSGARKMGTTVTYLVACWVETNNRVSNITDRLKNSGVLGLLANETKVQADGPCMIKNSVDFGKNKLAHGFWRVDRDGVAGRNEFDLLTSN